MPTKRKPTAAEKAGDQSLRILLGWVDGVPWHAEPFGPILVLGPHRSRRTTGVVIPALRDWPGPALVTSLGGDVAGPTIPDRAALGGVVAFDPGGLLGDVVERTRWTPMEQAREWDQAQVTARILADSAPLVPNGDQRWHAAGVALLATHLFAAAANGYGWADVLRWIDTEEEFEVRSLLQATGMETAIMVAESAWQREAKSRSEIYAELQVSLGLGWRPGRDEPENRDLIQNFWEGSAGTLYLCAPLDARHDYRPYSTAFAWTAIRSGYLNNRGFAASKLDRHGPEAAIAASPPRVKPFLVVLDDAADVAPIPDLNDLVSTAGKAAVQVISVFTDVAQMQSVYGGEAALSLVNNHATVVILPGSRDPATADLVNRLLRHQNPFGEADGLPPAEMVRRLPRGRALAVSRQGPPVILDLDRSPAAAAWQGIAGLPSGRPGRAAER
ncbi:type IV secretory system conjugative DNA transfer family protein [Actinoplanes missouriensis]|nr:type IV secretory system conjugative DNA transfer family protein [Actinoplanes missouriensis]